MMLAAICAPPLLARGALRPEAGPRILRWFLERCGGGYVKIGQLLATRYDLLPAAYCEELGKLFDDVRPVPRRADQKGVQQIWHSASLPGGIQNAPRNSRDKQGGKYVAFARKGAVIRRGR
jgi:ubiquinone biosynthesis protein